MKSFVDDPKQLKIESERLRVEIAVPGAVYQGARFSWCGFVTQVTLDGNHTFCARETEKGPREGGAGLCHEFGIFAPIGYDEAAPGEWFPKLGVGLLQKLADEPWQFARPYPIQPFPVQVERIDNGLHFVDEALPCRGYAAHFEQTLSVRGNQLEFACRLENVGEKRLETHEYRHNFLALNGSRPGPQLELETSFSLQRPPRDESKPSVADEILDLETLASGACVRWNRDVEEAFMEPFEGFQSSRESNRAWWELRHQELGLSVREEIDKPLCGFNLWSARDVCSPEAFVEIALDAGQSLEWHRLYTFEIR